MKPQNLLKQRRSTVSTATSVFDSLDSVSLDFMLGQWKGFEIITGHPMEGLLEPSGWYGKLFIDTENVHPLLMNTLNKKGLYAINPFLIPLGRRLPKTKLLRLAMAIAKRRSFVFGSLLPRGIRKGLIAYSPFLFRVFIKSF